jgi:hypothetical protein
MSGFNRFWSIVTNAQPSGGAIRFAREVMEGADNRAK